MADANANIRIDVDTSAALSQIKELQRQISVFHSRMAQSGKAAAAESAKMQANLINSINATKGFSAGMTSIRTSTESFTNSLEKNKFSMGEYFRYAGASTKTFGKLFKSEFNTINKVARERVKDLQTQYIKLGRDASGSMKAIKIRPTTLDMQNLGTQTAIAAQKQQLFNQLMKQGSTNLLNFGKNTQWAGRQLMVGFTIPLTIMGATASREFMKLEEQAIRFKRVYGDMFTSDKETKEALDNVKELAKEFTKFGVAVEDTIDLAASVAQMGAMGADLTNQVTQATRLAVLGGIEQQEALDTTISLTNAFGLATEQLAGKIAFLNAAENQTILSIEDFNEAIPKAGSVVKQLGGDVEDLAYFLTAMREGGVNASQSANALKSSLARLINPTEVAQQKLAGFGVDILGIVNDNAGNLRKTIQVLAVELDKLDPLNKSRAIEQLFGKFQFARMSTLFENIVKEGSQANKVLELTTNSTEELAIIAERELARVSESPMYKFKKSIEEFQVALAPIGEAFLKLATPLIEFASRAMEQFDKLSDGTKSFITGAVAIGGVVAPALIMVIGLLANGLANAVKFGMLVRNAFNGARQSSDLLTDQYQYMNSEQIEAAAVASSLDQVHAKLRQTFTSEATAVNKLTAAYERAIVKQNQMAASGAAFGGKSGRGAAPKKYNSGVVSVPGPKGKGDIVPAMLTPGEAVIPAEMAKKYAPLIQNMISDNIPGFKKGVSSVNFAHVGPGAQIPVGQALADSGLTPTAAVRRRMETLQKIDPSAPVNLKHSYGVAMDSKVNNRLGKAGGAGIDELAGQFTGKDIESRYGEMGKLIGADMKDPQLQKEFANYDKAMSAKLKGLKKQGIKSVVDTEEQWKALPKAQQKTTTSLEKMDKQVAKDIGKSNKKFIAARKKGLGTVRDIRIGEGLTPEQKKKILSNRTGNKNIIRRVSSKGDEARVYTSNQRKATGGFGKFPSQSAAYNDELEKQAQTKSPSKRTRKIAKDTVDGYAQGLKQGQKKVDQAAKKSTQARLQAEESYRKRSEAARKGWETRRLRQEQQTQAALASAGAAGRGGRLAGIGGRMRGMGGKMAMGAGGLSSVAMMASMAPGKVGETAGKLMMPLMGLTMILPMLTNKMGIAAVAIGALVAGVIAAKMSFEKIQKESLELTESLGSGSKAINEFAKAAGKVSSGEIMDKRRENQFGVFQIQPGKDTFGNTFMGSEAGETMKKNVGQGISTLGRDATANMITNQLATSVASGAMTTEQARSIVAALSSELGNASFGIDVNSRLTSLLGPSGENLMENPLELRVKLLQDNQKLLTESLDNSIESSKLTGGDFLRGFGGLVGGAAVGGLAGALGGGWAGAKIGGAIGSAIAPGIGTAIGAGIGVLGGAIGGFIYGNKKRNDRIAKSTGASVAMQKMALQQQQEMSDSLELEYEQRIATAKAAGDLAEVEELTNQRILDRSALLEENQKLVSGIQSQFADADRTTQNALMSGADKAIASQYEGTGMEDVAPLAQDLIKDQVADREVQYLLKMQMASGEIDPMQMMDFLTRFEKGSTEQDAIINLIATSGGAFANQVMGLVGMFEDEKIQADLVANFAATGNPEEAAELLAFYQAAAQTSSVLDREAQFRFLLENPSEADSLMEQIDQIKGLSPEDLAKEVHLTILNDDQLRALNSDMEYFNTLSPEMKKVYLQSLVTVETVTTADSEEFKSWLAENPMMAMNSTRPQQLDAFASSRARQVTQTAVDTTGQNTPPPGSSGSGSGPKASAFDGLLKKLRDVRDETISLKKGWKGATAALDKLFAGGKKSIDVFDGLANQMRRLGAGEGIISTITGMDPDEYEKRKDELFNFDKNGKISGLTSKFKSLAAAMNSVAIGEYVNTQEQFVANTNDQFTAINKLTSAGMSFVDAYEMVQDQALATAIATSATTEEMNKLLEIANLIEKTKERKNTLDEEAQAAKSVKKTNQEFMERAKVLSKLSKDNKTDAQISSILSDPNLTKLYLNPSIDPGTLEQRLRQAEAQASLELRVKVATEEGKEALFDELMGDVNDRFSMLEDEIEIDFKLATEKDNDIVRDAQKKIADIQYEIDDYQAELKGIADQEEDINEKYDKRYEALEKVATAQESIARAQQAQLTIADALSRGDIAAAARAQQELRDQEAEASREERRAQLERAQAAEIANVRSKSGKSRTELEDSIKAKQDEIFNIEEDTLEPAQDRIRLAEYQKEVAIDNLEIAGKTRDEWAKMASEVDLATFSLDEFKKKLQQIQALYDYFLNGTPLDGSLFGADELQELIDSGQVQEGDVYTPPTVTDTEDPEDVLGPAIVEAIEEGKEVDESKLTERQRAAKNLYEVNRLGKEGALATLQRQLSDPKSANKVATRIAKDAGIIGKDGGFAMSADAAERAMKKAIEAEAVKMQRKRDQIASLNYAKKVGTTNPDRLDAAYGRDIASIGKSTNIGKSITQQVASNYQERRDAQQTRTVLPPKPVYKTPTPKKTYTPYAKPAPKPAPKPVYKPPVRTTVQKVAAKKSYNTFKSSGMSLRAYMRSAGGSIPRYSIGGNVKGYSVGGFASMGTDTVPAMLTPGEFVVRRPAVQSIGLENLEKLNKTGTYNDGSVYNYNLAVNVATDADPNKIANTVMREIRRVESQRVRGNRI